MKKVKVIKAYFDKRQDRYPNLGETFEVEENRAKVLVEAGVAEIVAEASDGDVPTEETSEDTISEKTLEGSKQRVKKRTSKVEK